MLCAVLIKFHMVSGAVIVIMLASILHLNASCFVNQLHSLSSQVTFSVGDIRRRLSRDSVGPRKMFTRDPTDPSGSIEPQYACAILLDIFEGIKP